MAIQHISSSINGLLNQKDSLLGRLFGMAGSEARLQLLALKEKGDKYIASENCKNFDPLIGCCCNGMTTREAKRLTAIRNGYKNWKLVESEATNEEYKKLEKEMIELRDKGDTNGTEVIRASQRQLQ